MSVSVDISGLTELAARFDNQGALMEALRQGMQNAVVRVANYIVESKLSGQVLEQQSGRLADSVLNPPDSIIEGNLVIGRISSVFYGGVQEEGALINANVPVESSDTGWRHIDYLHARPWLEPSIQEKSEIFVEQMSQSIMEALRGS